MSREGQGTETIKSRLHIVIMSYQKRELKKITMYLCHCNNVSHLYKGTGDLRQKCTQIHQTFLLKFFMLLHIALLILNGSWLLFNNLFLLNPPIIVFKSLESGSELRGKRLWKYLKWHHIYTNNDVTSRSHKSILPNSVWKPL